MFDVSNLPLQPKYSLNPIIVFTIAIVLFLFEPHSSRLLEFTRDGIDHQQYWRILTGNWLHSNGIHLILNLAGVLFIWLLHAEHYTIKSFQLLLTWCAIGCGLGLYFFSDLSQYVGLSGALHGVIAYGAVKDISKNKFPITGFLLLVGIFIKVGHENIYGANDSLKVWIETEVAVSAHLFGLIAGLVAAIPLFITLIRQWVSRLNGHKSDQLLPTANHNDLNEKIEPPL